MMDRPEFGGCRVGYRLLRHAVRSVSELGMINLSFGASATLSMQDVVGQYLYPYHWQTDWVAASVGAHRFFSSIFIFIDGVQTLVL